MTKTLKLLTIASLLSLFSPSCSLLNHNTSTFRGDQGEINETNIETAVLQPKKEETKTKETTKKSKKNHQNNNQMPVVSDNLASQIQGKLEGEWTIVAVDKHKIDQEDEMPYIYFDESNNKFYASNGCNIINGGFSFVGDNALEFDHVLTTLRDCPDLDYPQLINHVLRDGTIVNVMMENSDKGSSLFLLVDGKKVMTLRRHNTEAINGEWNVVQIEDKPISDDGVNLFFDVPELKIHGNTGCNFFNGTIVLDHNSASAISFSQMAVTMRACPNEIIERSFLVALEETHSYTISGNTLKLLNINGRQVMVLKRIE